MKIRFLYCLLFIPFFSISQNGENLPLYFDYLTINEGLSHNTVFCMLQDKYGYVWIGTQNGLNKFDGYSFQVYKEEIQNDDRNGFKGKIITTLYEDSKGNLWTGTRKNGINIKGKHSIHFQNLSSDTLFINIKDAWISSILEDSDGHIWIGTRGRGLLKYDIENQSFYQYSSDKKTLEDDNILDIAEDENGTIWVATFAHGLSYIEKIDEERATISEFLVYPNRGGYRESILVDDDKLWIGAEGIGVYILDLKTKQFNQIKEGNGDENLNTNLVREFLKVDDDHTYIATDGGGLNVFHESTQKISKLTYSPNRSNTLNTNAVFCFLEDRSGNIWIGTYNGGINIYKKDKTWFDFITPSLEQGEELKHKSIISIYEDNKGTVWLGTDGGGMSQLQQKDNQLYISNIQYNRYPKSTFKHKIVKSIFQDSKNNLWIGSFNEGLEKYDPLRNESKIYTNTDPNNNIRGNSIWTIAEAPDGKMWFGTLGVGVSILDINTDQFSHFYHDENHPSSISDNTIMVITRDHDDQMWVGTMDSGLSLWKGEEEGFIHFQTDPNDTTSISGNEIRSIFSDSKKNLWVGTEDGGLNLYLGDGKFKRITKKNGLISNSVMGIIEDDKGYIWITTYIGISRLNSVDFKIRNFDFHNEQNNNQFNQASILMTSNNDLLFGGINGLNSIHQDQIKDNENHPDIIFTKLKVFNKEINSGQLPDKRTILRKPIEEAEAIYLDYYDNSFSIDFGALDHTNPLGYDFEYQMEGFNSEWQGTEEGVHSVNYTNLDPGNYTFNVRLMEKMISIKVIIDPPYWDTFSFKFFSFLIILSLLIGTAYFFLKRREETHQQKLLEAESEILQLKNDKLATEVSSKNSKLMFTSIQMAHKNEILNVVKKDLNGIDNPNNKIRSILRMIDSELENEDYWKHFNIYFNQVDQDFVKALHIKHPNLTQNDIRICTLLRLQLNTKEIASLLNITTRGVEKSRERLKKRLELTAKENLLKYILGFDTNI